MNVMCQNVRMPDKYDMLFVSIFFQERSLNNNCAEMGWASSYSIIVRIALSQLPMFSEFAISSTINDSVFFTNIIKFKIENYSHL